MPRTESIHFPTGQMRAQLNTLMSALTAAREAADDAAEVAEQAAVEAAEAQIDGPRRAGSSLTPAREREQAAVEAAEDLERQYLELRDESLRTGLTVYLRGITRADKRRIVKEYPPRVGDEGTEDQRRADALLGFNTEAGEDTYVYYSLERVVDGETEVEYLHQDGTREPRGTFDQWADRLPEADWQAIIRLALNVGTVAVHDPKSPAPWRTQTPVTN